MNPCESRDVTITFQNNGTVAWTHEKGVVLIPKSNCGISIIPQHVELERGIVVYPGDFYTFNFTITAPCTNIPCNMTSRISRYATSKSSGIPFGDISSELVVVSDQQKQVVKVLPLNTTKDRSSFTMSKEYTRNTTFPVYSEQRFVTLPAPAVNTSAVAPYEYISKPSTKVGYSTVFGRDLVKQYNPVNSSVIRNFNILTSLLWASCPPTE